MGKGEKRKRLKRQFGCDCTKWLGAVRLTNEAVTPFLISSPEKIHCALVSAKHFLLTSHCHLQNFQGNNFRLQCGDLSAIFIFQWARHCTLATLSNTSCSLGSVFLNHNQYNVTQETIFRSVTIECLPPNFVFCFLTLLDVSKNKVRSLAVPPSKYT